MTEQKPMTTQDAAQQAADANQKAYEDAVQKMDNHQLFERVRIFHPHAATSPDLLKAMVADYERLKAEADKA